MALNAQQLRWRCRRGVRELDVLFGRFLEHEHQGLDAQGVSAFERLLEVQDPVIMDWLFDRTKPTEPDLQALIDQLKKLSGLV